jgi:hypothetical protein
VFIQLFNAPKTPSLFYFPLKIPLNFRVKIPDSLQKNDEKEKEKSLAQIMLNIIITVPPRKTEQRRSNPNQWEGASFFDSCERRTSG